MANMNEAWLPTLSRKRQDNLSKQRKGTYSSARQSGQKICAQLWHQNVFSLLSSPLRHSEKKAWQELCGRRLCALRCCPLLVGDGWTGWWRQAKAGPCSLPLLPHQYFARDIFGYDILFLYFGIDFEYLVSKFVTGDFRQQLTLRHLWVLPDSHPGTPGLGSTLWVHLPPSSSFWKL